MYHSCRRKVCLSRVSVQSQSKPHLGALGSHDRILSGDMSSLVLAHGNGGVFYL